MIRFIWDALRILFGKGPPDPDEFVDYDNWGKR